MPNQKLTRGQFNLNVRDLKTSQGHRYFFLNANNTIVPQYIQITDYRLTCTIEEDFNLPRI